MTTTLALSRPVAADPTPDGTTVRSRREAAAAATRQPVRCTRGAERPITRIPLPVCCRPACCTVTPGRVEAPWRPPRTTACGAPCCGLPPWPLVARSRAGSWCSVALRPPPTPEWSANGAAVVDLVDPAGAARPVRPGGRHVQSGHVTVAVDASAEVEVTNLTPAAKATTVTLEVTASAAGPGVRGLSRATDRHGRRSTPTIRSPSGSTPPPTRPRWSPIRPCWPGSSAPGRCRSTSPGSSAPTSKDRRPGVAAGRWKPPPR